MSAIAPYREYLLLAALPGWRAGVTTLSEDGAGAYRLDALPGNARAMALPPLDAPLAIAIQGADVWDGCADECASGTPRLVALDAACQRIASIAIENPVRWHVLPGVGGVGHGARHFHHAQDIAVMADGTLAVADTAIHQVKLFTPYPFALLAVWDGLGAPSRIAAGRGGWLWVLDGAARRVIGLDGDGRVQASLPGLSAPAALAADRSGQVAVIDGTTVLLFPRFDAPAVALGSVPAAQCVVFGPGSFVYIGTSTGLIYGFAPAAEAGTWRSIGVGVLGQPGAITRLVWQGGTTLLALVRAEGAASAAFWCIDTAAAFVVQGSLATEELDSGITGCVWHRIALDADIPAGTSVEIRTEAYDTAGGASPPDLIPAPIVLSDGGLDCLVQGGAGRFLKLTLTVRGNGAATPTLRGIRIWFPRASWLQYLPAAYQEDDESASFLSRFLSILQTGFDGFDETIDNIARHFDPASVPDQWFAWLAAWIALPINPLWNDVQRRAVLKAAFRNYAKRGTPAGLAQIIADYAGVEARLVEHFRLRQLIVLPDNPAKAVTTGAGRLWSRDFYRRLQLGVYSQLGMFKLVGEPEPGIEPLAWGANEFSVFFDAEPMTMPATRKKVVTAVENEKPAHTMATYRPVYARMRIGVQATLGVDTRVGDAGRAVLGCVSTLGYDAVLAPSALETSMRAMGAPLRPRLGVNMRLC